MSAAKPTGIQMRTTIANDTRIFKGKSVAGNGGGGVQFEVLNKERIPDEVFTKWFTNPRTKIS